VFPLELELSDADGILYVEPRSIPTTFTAARYETGHVVTKRSAQPFVPVTQQRMLAAALAAARHDKRAADIDRLEHVRLSPDEAKAQGFAAGSHSFARSGDKDARAVATVNPSFFDRKLARAAIQLLLVRPATSSMLSHVAEKASLRDELTRKQPWPKLLDATT
jgi:hypothetical protein